MGEEEVQAMKEEQRRGQQELDALKLQEATLRKHMQILEDFESVYKDMASGLKRADGSSKVIKSLISFFDHREKALLDGDDEADDVEQIKVYIKAHLSDHSIAAWSQNL